MESTAELVKAIYDSTFDGSVTFRANGRLDFDQCVESKTFAFLTAITNKLWSKLVQRALLLGGDLQYALDEHCSDSDWSVYNELVTFRCTYAMCIKKGGECVIHDAVLVMIGSEKERQLLRRWFESYLENKLVVDYVFRSLWVEKDLLGFVSGDKKINWLFERLFEAPAAARSIRAHLAGCYITNGVVYYGMFREINNNLRCHVIVPTENIIIYFYENNRGGGHKVFTKFAPSADSIIEYKRTNSTHHKVDTDNGVNNKIKKEEEEKKGDDVEKVDWNKVSRCAAEAENIAHFTNSKWPGDESKCKFGQLYWRDSTGRVSTVTETTFEALYTTRCLDQTGDVSNLDASVTRVEYERDYPRWRSKTFEYCLSTSVQGVHVDDLKNKIKIHYPDPIAQMLDKEPVHTNPMYWVMTVHRGLVMSSMSRTLTIEADSITKRQQDKRSDRQFNVNSKCQNNSSVLKSNSSRNGVGINAGGGVGGIKRRRINKTKPIAAKKNKKSPTAIGGGDDDEEEKEDCGSGSKPSVDDTNHNDDEINNTTTTAAQTTSIPKKKKDSVLADTNSNNSILNTILHAIPLVKYNIAGFQRSKQKNSSNVHMVKKIPSDSYGYVDNVNTGIMAAAGKRSFLTRKCIRSYGFNGNHYRTKELTGDFIRNFPEKFSLITVRPPPTMTTSSESKNFAATATTTTYRISLLLNNRLLTKIVEVVVDEERDELAFSRWFFYSLFLPLKRIVPLVECQLIHNVVDGRGATAANVYSLFVNILFTNGVLQLQLPVRNFFSLLWNANGAATSSAANILNNDEIIAVSRFELESLVWFSNGAYLRETNANNNRLVDQGRDLLSLDSVRSSMHRIRSCVVADTNKLILDFYDRVHRTFPKSALIEDMFCPHMNYNESKRSQCGANCSKTMSGSIDYLDTSRLLNSVLQFFTAPDQVERFGVAPTPLESLMRTTLQPFARTNFYLLKCCFGNVEGLNVEDAIVVNSRLNLNIHALMKITVRVKFTAADRYKHFLDTNTSVVLPRIVESRAFDVSWSKGVPKTYTGGLFNVIKRDPVSRRPLVVLVPVAEIYCDKQEFVDITFDQYPKYIVERYGTNNAARYQIYKMFDDVFLLDIVHRIETSGGGPGGDGNYCDLGNQVQLLRHDDTVIHNSGVITPPSPPSRVEKASMTHTAAALTVVNHVIRLEFVVRVPHFDGMKFGNEWAEKGMCVVKDLSTYFERPEEEPDIVFNITSVLSRATSGQYFNMLRNNGKFVRTKSGQLVFVGHAQCFPMNTYISSLMSTIRACVPFQYALLAQQLCVSYQQLRANDIMNPTGRVVPPNVENIFKLYSPLGCNIEWIVDNRGRVQNPSIDTINTTKFLDRRGYEAFCKKYAEFEVIAKNKAKKHQQHHQLKKQ